jgi:hypothetical protein
MPMFLYYSFHVRARWPVMDVARQNTFNILKCNSRTKVHETFVTPSVLDDHGRKKADQAATPASCNREVQTSNLD